MSFTSKTWAIFEKVSGFNSSLPKPLTMPFADILFEDALQCGLDPKRHNIWGSIVPLGDLETKKRDKTLILVGERIFTSVNSIGEKGKQFALDFPTGQRLFFRPWHAAIKLHGNPLSLHAHFRSGQEPEINMDIPWGGGDWNTTEIARYSNELCKELPALTEYPLPSRGRPKGPAQPMSNFEKMKEDCEFYLERGYTQEKIIELLGIKDVKTLRNYMRQWGLK